MRRKIIIPVVLVAAVIALLVGVLVVPARGGAGTTTTAATTTLPTLSPLELFAKVAATLPSTKAVHGQFTWTNNVLGESFQLPAEAPALLKDLFKSGSGEFWFQGGKLRLQAGKGTDQVTVVMDGTSLWVNDSTSNTATQYALPADTGTSASPSPGANGFNPGNLGNLSQLMSAVTLSVDQRNVAGQDAYVLTVKPTATNTTLGSINVAFDGTSFVPLSVNVTDSGGNTVLDATMSKVDYAPIDAGQFDYTPPSDAHVVHATMDAAPQDGTTPQSTGTEAKATMQSLTIAEAQAKVGFPLLSIPSPTAGMPFQGAYVVGDKSPGPFAILRYGQGFGTVVLAEGKLTAAEQTQVLDALGATNLGTPAAVDGSKATKVTTPLVNAFIWTTADGVFHVAAGPVTDLQTFVDSLK
jgi:outer membrane lipoprotein-sorting protein